MKVYSEQPNSEDWLKAEMCYVPKCKSYSAAVYELPDITLYIIRLTTRDSRRNRMLNDIYLWVRDSPRSNRRSCDTNLLIFSDQFHDDAYFTDMLQQLSKKVYRLLLVTPTQDINEPACSAWPGLLIDEGAYCFRGT
ncbi:hypothetical protein F2Q68_00007065 [Brassica cretica]|uniref:Uncharacterized protein n=1 Tax=Brassica cretica TaxID=69181 RepID=A0A8S9L132_BRACR|nr:hypothetical protein F2Q68_00007065 [Brassica cretica]